MKGNPIQTYALTVCFASLLAGSISLAVGIFDIIQISFPETTIAPYRAQMEAAQKYQLLQDQNVQIRSVRPPETPADDKPTFNIVTSGVVSPTPGHFVGQALQSLIFSSIVFVISVGVFLFHWRLTKKYFNFI